MVTILWSNVSTSNYKLIDWIHYAVLVFYYKGL